MQTFVAVLAAIHAGASKHSCMPCPTLFSALFAHKLGQLPGRNEQKVVTRDMKASAHRVAHKLTQLGLERAALDDRAGRAVQRDQLGLRPEQRIHLPPHAQRARRCAQHAWYQMPSLE